MMRRFFLLVGLLLPLAASAQTISGGAGSVQRLYATGVSVGNGADLTADVLQTYTIPGGTLVNVGDTIHVIAGGTFIGSTDAKTASIKFGATTQGLVGGSAVGATRWYAEVWFTKTGTNTQSYIMLGISLLTPTGTNSNTTTQLEANPLTVTVVGTNATSSVAGSITCQLMIVDLIRGS